MTDQSPTVQPDPAEPATTDRPLASSDAASAPVRRGFTLRGRKWVYGATLLAAGVLTGSGVTYGVVGTSPTSQVQSFQSDGTGPRGGGPMGGGQGGRQGTPPDGQAPDGQAAQGGGTTTGGTTTGGATT